MHKIETLPREIKYNGKYYFLNVHITAWGKLCVGYTVLDVRVTEDIHILSNVIEEKENVIMYFIPKDVTDIMNVTNFDDAVDTLEIRVNDAIKLGQIELA